MLLVRTPEMTGTISSGSLHSFQDLHAHTYQPVAFGLVARRHSLNAPCPAAAGVAAAAGAAPSAADAAAEEERRRRLRDVELAVARLEAELEEQVREGCVCLYHRCTATVSVRFSWGHEKNSWDQVGIAEAGLWERLWVDVVSRGRRRCGW